MALTRTGWVRANHAPERGGYFVNMFDPEGSEFDVH